MDYNIIIGVACFGAILQTLSIWDELLQKLFIDVKPFNCALCMTFWSSLGPFIISEGAVGIFNSIITAVLAELIYKQLSKS